MHLTRALPTMASLLILACAALWTAATGAADAPPPDAKAKAEADLVKDVSQGALRVVQKDGAVVECPLKHTDVQAEIAGFIARVKVTQTFFNPLDEKIEAVYVFPLPHESAVDEMTMVLADRRIIGLIKRRAEARHIYEQALAAGQTAALLEQERPNIFTQSVGNIPPKQEVKIEIGYVDVLKYDQGCYEFHFPMVVGPRYNPAGFSGGIGAVPRTEEGRSGQKVEVSYLKPGERNGHDISLRVRLDAGVPIQDLQSILHKADIQKTGAAQAAVTLAKSDAIPNKDFILKYKVLGAKPEMAALCHTDGSSGYFMLMIQPKEDEKLAQMPPREIIFMQDISGSQMGWPIAKATEAMKEFLTLLREKDTFQVITFASAAQKLFERPVPVTKENVARAMNFAQSVKAGGGTEMLKGVQMAIDEPIDKERVRVVIMFTDGYIGNEAQILDAVGKGCGDQIKFWCLGIGNSINRFLVDGVAKQGGGMSKVITLKEDAAPIVRECMERIQRAQLSKIKLDWGGLKVSEVYPARIPELWAGRPVIVFGLYDLHASDFNTTVTVSGFVEGEPASWPLAVRFPKQAEENLALAKTWARQKIESLMQQTYYAGSPEVEEEVTAIALDYRLMSQYTSFVAVDEKEIPKLKGEVKPPRRMMVAVPMPEGVSWEGNFGGAGASDLYLGDLGGKGGRFRADAPADPAAAAGNKPFSGGWGEGRGGWGNRSQMGRRYMASSPGGAHGGAANGRYKAAPGPTGMPTSRTPASPVAIAGGLQEQTESPVLLGGYFFASDELSKDREGEGLVNPGLWHQFVSAEYQTLQKRLPELVKEVEGVPKENRLAETRAKWAYLCLLDTALANSGLSNGATADKALVQIADCEAALLAAWKKQLPALDKTLDFVLRDVNLAEALAQVAKAGGVKVSLVPGSAEDAAALLERRELRVTYLDLRNATLAQALDFILKPLRLRWQVPAAAGEVVACSDPRDASVPATAWVYDVSRLTFPLKEELDAEKDAQKHAALYTNLTNGFMQALRAELKLPAEALTWYAPGQVLIWADVKTHAQARNLFEALGSPGEAQLGLEATALRKLTQARAEKRKDLPGKLLDAREKAEVYQALHQFSLPLLNAWIDGKLDDEALTELNAAWGSKHIAELLKGPAALEVCKSAWAIREVWQAIAGKRSADPERKTAFSSLADLAGKTINTALPGLLAAQQKNKSDRQTFRALFWATLALREDAEATKDARAILTAAPEGADPFASDRCLCTALLTATKDGRLLDLIKKTPEQIQGDDAVLWAALACRRAGGEAWEAFRGEQKQLLGSQALSGSVVVLVNKLGRAKLGVTGN